MKTTNILILKPSESYELIDSGEEHKLERFGDVVLSRPDPQALWRKRLSPSDWKKASGAFSNGAQDKKQGERGEWTLVSDVPKSWPISFAGLSFIIKPTPFKHVGIFPEQAENWKWMEEKIRERREADAQKGESKDIEVLNLFAYTGGATLACAKAGAKVVHVDGSKAAIAWARENADLSKLSDKPIRWILDDARAFVKRELKRGRKYQGIIMDPPSFGHGADNEVWKIEDDLLDLIEMCAQALVDDPVFFVVNGYSAGYSALAYENNLLPLKKSHGGSIEAGELTIQEKGEDGRLLPCGIFARWSNK